MTLRRLGCAICGDSWHSLYTDWERRERNQLHYSTRLDNHFHPSCMDAVLGDFGRYFGIPMEPFRRLLELGSVNSIKESANDQHFHAQ